jgi:hypothetical protein
MARERKAVLGRTLAAMLLAAAVWLPSCTTFVEPVQCQGPPFSCNERSDVKFCQYTAVAVEGTDCANVGMVASKDFCVVTATACVDTSYAVKGRDCRVLEYHAVRAWRQCPVGTPTFSAP